MQGDQRDGTHKQGLKSILKKPGARASYYKQAAIVEPTRNTSVAKGVTFHLGSTRTTSSISSTFESLSHNARRFAQAFREGSVARFSSRASSGLELPLHDADARRHRQEQFSPPGGQPQPGIFYPGYQGVWFPQTPGRASYPQYEAADSRTVSRTRDQDSIPPRKDRPHRRPKKPPPKTSYTPDEEGNAISAVLHKKSALTRMDSDKRRPAPITLASFICYAIFVVLAVVSMVLHGFNEARLARTRALIRPFAENYFPVSCEPDDANNGLLIHVDCPLRDLNTFYPPAEFQWSVDAFTGLFFEMKVEMFQWVVQNGGLGVSFEGEWRSNLIDSSDFPFLFYNTHVNPSFFPAVPGAGRHFAPNARAGGFHLRPKSVMGFRDNKQLGVRDDGFFSPPDDRPPPIVDYSNTQAFQNALYTGDPFNPKIGDLRISFWGSTASHVSAIAKQERNGFRSYELVDTIDQALRRSRESEEPHSQDPATRAKQLIRNLQNVTFPERETALIREGDFPPEQLISEAVAQRDGSHAMMWTVRVLSFVLVYAFVLATYHIANRDLKYIHVRTMFGSSLSFALFLYFGIAGPIWVMAFWIAGVPMCLVALAGLIVSLLVWFRPRPAAQRPSEFITAAKKPLRQRESSRTELPHYYHPV